MLSYTYIACLVKDCVLNSGCVRLRVENKIDFYLQNQTHLGQKSFGLPIT